MQLLVLTKLCNNITMPESLFTSKNSIQTIIFFVFVCTQNKTNVTCCFCCLYLAKVMHCRKTKKFVTGCIRSFTTKNILPKKMLPKIAIKLEQYTKLHLNELCFHFLTMLPMILISCFFAYQDLIV